MGRSAEATRKNRGRAKFRRARTFRGQPTARMIRQEDAEKEVERSREPGKGKCSRHGQMNPGAMKSCPSCRTVSTGHGAFAGGGMEVMPANKDGAQFPIAVRVNRKLYPLS